MSLALDRDLALLEKEALSYWQLRTPHRAVKAVLRSHPHYPKPGSLQEAAFLNGAFHMLHIIRRREREVRIEFSAEESEAMNMSALNLETVVLKEMIDEFNRKVSKQ